MITKKIAQAPIEHVDRTPVVFQNQDSKLTLAGIVYRPQNRRDGEQLPLIIIGGPMASVKELTQSLYAQLLAERGYATMVFDHSYVGASEGHPRGYEDPEVKGSDWRSAITFAQSLPYIDSERIAGIGICGSGVYLPCGVRDDRRMKAIVSIVPFTIMNFIVTGTDEQLLQQKSDYENNGSEPERLHLIEPDSEGAAYYFDTNRGAAANMVEIPSWSQLTWHQFFPTETVKQLQVPYMVITAENAFTRQGAEEMFKNAPEPKELHIIKNATHFEMYDIEEYVLQNIEYIEAFLKRFLK